MSALADGEASADDLRALRPHLRTCLACRARLREFRAAPKRVAALLPPLAAANEVDPSGSIRSLFESLVGGLQDRRAAVGERAHTAAELATGQKVAAVAATAAAMAGGGAGVKELAVADHPPVPSYHRGAHHAKPTPRAMGPSINAPVAAPKPPAPAAPRPQPAPQPAPKPPPPPPAPADPATEFAPAAGPASPSPAAPTRSGGGGSGGGGSAGAGEFGP